MPPLGLPQHMKFSSMTKSQESELKRFPYASTCSTVLFLPRGRSSEDELLEMVIEAVHGSAGFG